MENTLSIILLFVTFRYSEMIYQGKDGKDNFKTANPKSDMLQLYIY